MSTNNLQIVIECDPIALLNGNKEALKVAGPLKQKALCYMILELTKDYIRDYADKAAESRIIDPHTVGLSIAGG